MGLKDFGMTVDVKTPIQLLREPQVKIELDKKGSRMKMKLSKKKKNEAADVYAMNGISDYDIFTNLIPSSGYRGNSKRRELQQLKEDSSYTTRNEVPEGESLVGASQEESEDESSSEVGNRR